MRPFGDQPRQDELEELLDDQERAVLERDDVPDDEKVEIVDRLEAWEDADLEEAGGDEPLRGAPG